MPCWAPSWRRASLQAHIDLFLLWAIILTSDPPIISIYTINYESLRRIGIQFRSKATDWSIMWCKSKLRLPRKELLPTLLLAGEAQRLQLLVSKAWEQIFYSTDEERPGKIHSNSIISIQLVSVRSNSLILQCTCGLPSSGVAVRKTRGPASGPHVQKGKREKLFESHERKLFCNAIFLFKCCVVCNQFKFKICFSHQSHFQRQNPKKTLIRLRRHMAAAC